MNNKSKILYPVGYNTNGGFKYRSMNIRHISNHWLLKFVTSKEKLFKAFRIHYKKQYRAAYTLCQLRGLI